MTDMPLERQRTVAGVRFHRVGKLYHFDFAAYPDLQMGDHVIVETARGRQMGQIVSFTPAEDARRDNKPIMRPATPRDLALKQVVEEVKKGSSKWMKGNGPRNLDFCWQAGYGTAASCVPKPGAGQHKFSHCC